jgi:hypothetical protein
MRIGGVGSRPGPTGDVASALSNATGMLGQRPAVTGHVLGQRREQGFASLAGWVAKGANLLALERGLGPGDRLGLAGPPGWPLAAIALSAWWIGMTVVPARGIAPDRIEVQVVHVGSTGVDVDGDVLWFGDEVDGTGAAPSTLGEQWTDAVTPHADRPPIAPHDGSLVAFADHGGASATQGELLATIAQDPGGALGIVRVGHEDLLARPDAATMLSAVALRPLVTGAASVVILDDDPERDEHERAERITRWVR